MSGCRFPEGLCALRVNHHGVSQPSIASRGLASPSQRLLGHVSHRARWPAPLMSKSSWEVGRIRARYLTARLPNPPVRPVRETFASYGSRQRDIMGMVHFASSTVHSPWTALRVRWVPVYCCPTRSLRAFALCAVCPHSDSYALFDCLQGLGVSSGSPHAYSPPSLPSLAGSPVFTVEDSKQNAVGGVLLLAPSTLWGFPDTP